VTFGVWTAVKTVSASNQVAKFAARKYTQQRTKKAETLEALQLIKSNQAD
jgi:hypothetical protein